MSSGCTEPRFELRPIGIGPRVAVLACEPACGRFLDALALRRVAIHACFHCPNLSNSLSIEAGKFADLLILDRDPLASIVNTQSLRFVMKNGRLYDAETLDEVWPRQQPLEAQWFWSEAPQASSLQLK